MSKLPKTTIRTLTLRGLLLGSSILLAGLTLTGVARAADQTWNAGGDKTSWFDGDNWVGAAYPGASTGNASTDVATFDSSPLEGMTINIGSYLNIKQFSFQNGAGAYTFNADSGGALHINGNAGSPTGGIFATPVIPRTDANAPITINAPIILESSSVGDGNRTVVLRNDSTQSTSPFLITGNITTAATSGNKRFILNLSAKNNGHANEVSGDISDGLATGGLAVSKTDNGLWILSGDNTYSGGTTSSGTLGIHSNTALGTGDFVITAGAIQNTSGADVTLTANNNIFINGGFNAVMHNDLNLGTGDVTLGANINVRSQLSLAGTKLTIGGDISDGGNGYGISRITDANGELILNGKRTYGGATSVNAGILTLGGESTSANGTSVTAGQLNLNHAKSLGTGDLVIGGGTIGNTSGAAVVITTTNAQTWNGNFTFAGPDDLDLGDGAVSLGTTVGTTRQVTVTSNVLSVGGVISDGTTVNSLGKIGAGTLVLYGDNDYTGTTTVAVGTLIVDGGHSGAGAYSVAAGAILGGGGSISTANDAGVTLATGAKLSPGGLDNPGTLELDLGAGTLSIGSAVNGKNSQSLLFTLGASSDKVLLSNAASTLSIGSGLEFDDFVFTAGSGFGAGIYTLFETASTITGSLGTNLTGQIGGLDAELSLAGGGQNIILTVVPEPATGALLLLTGLGMATLRRRRIG